jgi:hypothetical protein
MRTASPTNLWLRIPADGYHHMLRDGRDDLPSSVKLGHGKFIEDSADVVVLPRINQGVISSIDHDSQKWAPDICAARN